MQEGQSQLGAAQLALNAAIEADRARPNARLSIGTHALYRLINQDTSLRKQFLDAFLIKILKELEERTKSGAISDIARHQMLATLYKGIPEVDQHQKYFVQHLSEGGYPWVSQVLRRIESGVASGLQIGKETLLVQSIDDLQRYVAVTSGVGTFAKLRDGVIKHIHDHYRKMFITSPVHDPDKLLERKEHLDRLVDIFSQQGIFDTGLEEIQKEIAASKTCAPLREYAKVHHELLVLEKKQLLLKEAQKGISSAEAILKGFQETPLSPTLKQAIEKKYRNVAGVTEWETQFADLKQIVEFAKKGNVAQELEKNSEQIATKHEAMRNAKEKLRHSLQEIASKK